MATGLPDSCSISLRFRSALYSFPLRRRIADLTSLFAECTIKDFQTIFPTLIENIFGVPQVSKGWNLRNISHAERNNKEDFNAVFSFLHPDGTLFDIAYRLLGDVYLKYHYPVSCLPVGVQQMIQQRNIPPYYLEKLNLENSASLLLNPFEFYMFHYAFHLISPWQGTLEQTSTSGSDSVYAQLTDVYLCRFLPIDTSIVLPVISIAHRICTPPPQTQPVRVSKLFKPSALKSMVAGPVSPVVSPPHFEIWRSEAILHIIIHFWLHIHDTTALMDNKFQDWRNSRASSDHLLIVRTLIKHMHYFANNVRNDGSTMDELRRNIRSVLQGPIVTFLRCNIQKWPLDSSFLLMLETYLSYIQPWRYQRYNSFTRAQKGESTNVDKTWMPFILENVEAYTAVLVNIIGRLTRMDLSSPRQSRMVFRLAKVLSEPDLPIMIQQADAMALSRNDLDGHVPLFTPNTEAMVLNLMRTMQATLMLVQGDHKNTKAGQSSTFVQSVRDWLLGSSIDDYSTNDRQTIIGHLENAILGFCIIFRMEQPDPPQETGLASVQPSLLDPRLVQKRATLFKYSGNPDLEPIRSSEITPFVRFLHRVSAAINETYGPQISELWYREDLYARMCKQFLAPPCNYSYFHKTGPGNPAPRVQVKLPPRVCLRRLAARRTVLFVAMIALYPHLWGSSPFVFYTLIAFIFSIVTLLRGLIAPYASSNSIAVETDPLDALDASFID